MPEFDAPIQPQAGGGDIGKLRVGGGFMSNLGEMQTGADNMLKAAKAGGFRCDPEGIKGLVKVCEDMRDNLEGKAELFRTLGQEPKLGSGPYAKQVAAHVASSATGDQGVVPQLEKFQATLTKLVEALYRASGQYEAADDAAKMNKAPDA